MKTIDCNSDQIADTSSEDPVEERQEILPHIPTL